MGLAGCLRGTGLGTGIALAFLLMTGVQAWAASCPAGKKQPQVQITYLDSDPRFDHSLSAEEIRDVHDDIAGFSHADWERPLGMAVSRLTARHRTWFSYAKMRGGYCAFLDRAEIAVGYSETTVYVDARYAAGTCQFNAVLDHELDHVRINQEVLDQYKPRLEAAVARVIRARPAIFAYRQGTVQSAYLRALERAVEPVLAALKRERERRNARLDTADSYRRVIARCPAW